MTKKNYENICDVIATISPYIRFVGVIGESGNLLAYKRRPELVPLLNEKKHTVPILTYCNEDRFRRIFLIKI